MLYNAQAGRTPESQGRARKGGRLPAAARVVRAQAPSLPTPEREIGEQRLERIAARAYEIYETRGGEHGQDLDDWLRAEQEIDAEMGHLDIRED